MKKKILWNILFFHLPFQPTPSLLYSLKKYLYKWEKKWLLLRIIFPFKIIAIIYNFYNAFPALFWSATICLTFKNVTELKILWLFPFDLSLTTLIKMSILSIDWQFLTPISLDVKHEKKISWTTNIFFFNRKRCWMFLKVFSRFASKFNYWIIHFRYPLIDTAKFSRLNWYTFFLSVHGILFVPVWALRDTEPMKNMAFYSQKNYKLRQVNSWPKQHSFSYATW